MRILFGLLFAAFLVGFSVESSVSYTTTTHLNGHVDMRSMGDLASHGGPFGWAVSWSLTGGNHTQWGPFVASHNGKQIGEALRVMDRLENTNVTWSVGSAPFVVDPCVHLVEEGQYINYTYGLVSNVPIGELKVTVYTESLASYGVQHLPFRLPLKCNPIECGKYSLLNLTTEHKNFSVELTFLSEIKASGVIAAVSGQCPSVKSNNNSPLSIELQAGKNLTITIPNARNEIWFHFSNYRLSEFSTSSITIDCKIIPASDGNTPGGESGPDNHAVKWAIIGSVISVVAIGATIAVITIIRKRRTAYQQIQ